MDSKSLKIASSALIVLILSSALGFPLNFKISIAQAMSTAENVARKIALEGPSNELDGEGVFYCSTPIKLDNGKYEYYLWITNPKNKKIRISFNEIVEAEYHIKAPVSISYWEPQFPENNVEVKGNILSTTDQNIFRVIQLDREAILNVEQEGGDPIRVQSFGECSKFLAIILYTINKVAQQAFEDPKYVAAERQLENAIIQTIDNLLASLSMVSFQGSEVKMPKSVLFVGDTGFYEDKVTGTTAFDRVKDLILDALKRGVAVIQAGDLIEKHASGGGKLTLDELLRFLNFIYDVTSLREKGAIYIDILGNHELFVYMTGKYGGYENVQKIVGFETNGAVISKELIEKLKQTNNEVILDAIIKYIESRPVAVQDGDALIIHNPNPEVLKLLFKYDLIDKPLPYWIKAAMEEYKEELKIGKDDPYAELKALYKLSQIFTQRAVDEKGDYKNGLIKALKSYESEFLKRGIKTIYIGHDNRYPGVNGFEVVGQLRVRNVKGEAVEYSIEEAFLSKPKLTESNVEVPDKDGNKKSMSFKDALKDASDSSKELKKELQAVNDIDDKVRVIELPKTASEFVQESQTLSKKVIETLKVVQDKIQSGALSQEEAKPIADALSKAQNAINSNDPNSFILAIDEFKSNFNILKGDRRADGIRLLVKIAILKQLEAQVQRQTMFSVIKSYLIICNEAGSCNEEQRKAISDLIKYNYERKYITKEEYDKYMELLKEPVESQIKKFDNEFNSEADGKKAANVVNEQIKEGGVSEALNNVEKQSSNIKSSQIAWYKSGRAQNFANKLLNLEKKISEFESKISIKIFKINNEVVKLGGFAIAFAIPIISSLLNDYFENNFIAQLAISSINLAFAIYLVRFFFQVAVLIIGVITGVTTVAALASAGIGFVIGLAVGIVVIAVFCFLNPNSTICLCNFRNAQYAISEKGKDPSYYKDKLDEKLKPDLTYYLYAIKVSGHGCNGVEYELEVKSSKSYTYPNKLRIGCMGEKDCAGSMEVEVSKIANNIDCYEACDINLKPPFDIFNPATWQSVYLGKITIDKSPVYPVIISNFVKTSDYSCSIEYENKLDESLSLKVYIVEPESSKVIDSKDFTIPAKGKGNLNVYYSQPKKKFYLQIFKSSDKNMENPIFTPPLVCG